MDIAAIPIASATIEVQLDMSKFKAQMASIGTTIEASGKKISTSMTNALAAQTKHTGTSIKEAITVIDKRMQQILKPILTATFGLMFAGIYKYMQTTESGAYKLQRSVNSLTYSWNQLLARIGKVVSEHFNLSTNIGKLIHWINSLNDAKLGKLLDKALWAAVALSVTTMAKGFMSMAADWQIMMKAQWWKTGALAVDSALTSQAKRIVEVQTILASAAKRGGQISSREAGILMQSPKVAKGISAAEHAAFAAASMSGWEVIWVGIKSLFLRIGQGLKMLGGFLSKFGLIIASVLGVFAVLGDKGDSTSRLLSGVVNAFNGLIWVLKKVWDAIVILLDIIETGLATIFAATDALKNFFKALFTGDFGAIKDSFKKAIDDMMETWDELFADMSDRWYDLFGGGLGGTKKPDKPDKPMTFAAKNIQTVGFTELGRAQQQIALQMQMASDTEDIKKNTARTAAATEKMAGKGRSGVDRLPLAPTLTSGSGGAGSSGSGGGGGGGGGW